MINPSNGQAGLIQLRLSGAGGQGLQLVARIIAQALAVNGRYVAQSQSYEPTSRGGLSRADLVIDDKPIDWPLVTGLDALLVLDQVAVAASEGLIKENAVVFVDSECVTSPPNGQFKVYPLPLRATAISLGSVRATNIVALGALAGHTELCPRDALADAVRGDLPEKLHKLNLAALARGYELAAGQSGSA